MPPHPFLDDVGKRYPAWDPREVVRESGEANRVAPPAPAWLPSSTVPFPFEAGGPFVAGMARTRFPARTRAPFRGVVAFVPAGIIRADLPILPESPFCPVAGEIRIPDAEVPGIRTSREEQRLEKRRRARNESEAEAKAHATRRLEDTEDALRRGGLWRAEDIAAAYGLGQGAVQSTLEALGAKGRAVEVALGHWRYRTRSADLAGQGRTCEARLLGHLLHGLSMDAGTLARLTGECPAEIRAAGARLTAKGLARGLPPDAVSCPDDVRRAVLDRIGPPVLSALGQRVVDDLFEAAPSRKVDVANRLGIGRGSVNRAIERLVEEGWLRSPEPDLFAVA